MDILLGLPCLSVPLAGSPSQTPSCISYHWRASHTPSSTISKARTPSSLVSVTEPEPIFHRAPAKDAWFAFRPTETIPPSQYRVLPNAQRYMQQTGAAKWIGTKLSFILGSHGYIPTCKQTCTRSPIKSSEFIVVDARSPFVCPRTNLSRWIVRGSLLSIVFQATHSAANLLCLYPLSYLMAVACDLGPSLSVRGWVVVMRPGDP
ncbi:hypothetical protein BJX63DRAFT_329371 [Aspergillus granulosus]|uniref:Uncharacterized protein n=1 Tax=Aspergillus granulosus TaxID=176169 RepID=A0ABR4H3N3_9EURO